jgi:hypothetical protein
MPADSKRYYYGRSSPSSFDDMNIHLVLAGGSPEPFVRPVTDNSSYATRRSDALSIVEGHQETDGHKSPKDSKRF